MSVSHMLTLSALFVSSCLITLAALWWDEVDLSARWMEWWVE